MNYMEILELVTDYHITCTVASIAVAYMSTEIRKLYDEYKKKYQEFQKQQIGGLIVKKTVKENMDN